MGYHTPAVPTHDGTISLANELNATNPKASPSQCLPLCCILAIPIEGLTQLVPAPVLHLGKGRTLYRCHRVVWLFYPTDMCQAFTVGVGVGVGVRVMVEVRKI